MTMRPAPEPPSADAPAPPKPVPAGRPVERLTEAYRQALRLAFALLPLGLVAYLHLFQDPGLTYRNYPFHEAAITLAVVLAGFVAYVTYRCYLDSGEPFLRHLTLAFLGFAIVYAPHGLLTRTADANMWLFLLYGPFSRLVMAAFMMAGLLRFGDPPDPVHRRTAPAAWWPAIGLFAAMVLAVAAIAYSPVAGSLGLRASVELTAIALCAGAATVMVVKRIRQPLMWFYLVALLWFAQSSTAFLLTGPWTHLWWAAHLIFAGGFLFVSYGVVRAHQIARSFETVYTEEEMIARLAASEAAADTLRQSEERMRALLRSSPVGVVVVDGTGEILFRNNHHDPVAAETGRGGAGLPSPAGLLGRLADPLRAALEQGHVTMDAEFEVPRPGGQPAWILASVAPIEYRGRPAAVVWHSDITPRKRAEDAMRRATEEAETASRAKTEFLAAMSHELRTPLNAILGFSETMQTEVFGPLGASQYQDYARDINDAGRHLLEIINDVLDIARIETGHMDLDLDEVALPEIVASAVRLVAGRAEDAGLALSVREDAAPPAVRADARRLKQALVNLLSNAIRFTPEGGRIEVRTGHDESRITVAVSDTGIGIAADDIPRALAVFGQVDSRLSRRFEGMGLGLPLVQGIMVRHGGGLEIDSTPGEGTTVTIWLPRASAGAEASAGEVATSR